MGRRYVYESAWDEARDAHDRHVEPAEYLDLDELGMLPAPRPAPAAETRPSAAGRPDPRRGRGDDEVCPGLTHPCGQPADETGFCGDHQDRYDPDQIRDLRTGR